MSHTQQQQQQQLQRAMSYHRSGRIDQAQVVYRQIIQHEPRNADALHLYGLALHQGGRSVEAVDYFSKALKLTPNNADIHANFADVWRALGRIDQALQCYRVALTINPNDMELHYLTALALTAQKKYEEATKAFLRVLRVNPNHVSAHTNVSMTLNYLGHYEEALKHSLRAIELGAPGHEAHFNAGFNYARMNRLDEAIPYFNEALRRNPNSHEAHYELGVTRLTMGDYAQGWPEFEWRLNHPQFPAPRDFDKPRWDGSDLTGRTILVHADQGLGDTIQWLRYLPLLERQFHGRVILECQRGLLPFIRATLPQVPVFAKHEPLPHFDVHVQITSLPFFFKTTLATIPTGTLSFEPDDKRLAHFRNKIRQRGSAFNVGLVWAGNPKHPNDAKRSMPLALFAPLAAQAQDVTFFSLQKGPPAVEAQRPPAGMRLVDLVHDLNDMHDTACAIRELDLIVTVDTSCAHLAGTIGTPVWNLIPFVPDFRWMLDRDDSPWYPTMRLFRQQSAGDWGGVIERVAGALSERVQQNSQTTRSAA